MSYIEYINNVYREERYIYEVWQKVFDSINNINRFKRIFYKFAQAQTNFSIYDYWYNHNFTIDEIMIKYYCNHYKHKFNEQYFKDFLNRYIIYYKYVVNNDNKIIIYLQKQIAKDIIKLNINKSMISIYITCMSITNTKNNKSIDILIEHINNTYNSEVQVTLFNVLLTKISLNNKQTVKIQLLLDQINSQLFLQELN